MRKSVFFLLALVAVSTFQSSEPVDLQFIFTSDSHYGLTRPQFRGATNVDAHVVNAAMIAEMNRLPKATFPADGGLRSGQTIGPIDFVANGGDIANRAEELAAIPSAVNSWAQFQTDYFGVLQLSDRNGKTAPVYVVPGNHDASNAVGYYKSMVPATDKSSMMGIFNVMMTPSPPRTLSTYDYSRDKIEVSHDVEGIHFAYLTIWPDSGARKWLEDDLKRIGENTPVIIFTHDPPDSDSKHFVNPNGKHDINATDKFENLLSDTFADEVNHARTSDAAPLVEQMALEEFLHRHPNVTAYFHGHNNWNQFYDWTGPNHSVTIHAFRVDSPMKGHFSATDETKLSFQIATLNTASRTITVREVLWNADPMHPNAPPVWGASTTVALAPRPLKPGSDRR